MFAMILLHTKSDLEDNNILSISFKKSSILYYVIAIGSPPELCYLQGGKNISAL